MRTKIAAVFLTGLLTALLTGLLLLPAPASAHSFLREAKPGVGATVDRGPNRVALWFNEAVEASFATITITNRRGRRVATGAPFAIQSADDGLMVRLPRRLPKGRYLVRWRVVSADSHIESGDYLFRVKRTVKQESSSAKDAASPAMTGTGGSGGTMAEGTAAIDTGIAGSGMAGVPAAGDASTLLVATRGLTMAGLLLLVGLIVFWLLAWRGIGAAIAPPVDIQRSFVLRWQRMATLALSVTVIATVAGVVLQGAAAANLPIAAALQLEVIEGVLATGFGKAAVGRLVLLEMLAVVAVGWRVVPLFMRPQQARTVGAAALQPGVSSTRLTLLTLVVLPLLLTMSMVSHATTATPVVLHLAADAVHLAAAGAWMGGLLVLTFAAFPATAALPLPERVRVLGPPVLRFSRIAAVSVALVVITGTFRGVETVGGWAALTTTGYGKALLVKLGIFAMLLLLGAFNHFWAIRRIRTAVRAGTATGALQALRRSVRVETVLAVVIVVVTAALVSLPMAP